MNEEIKSYLRDNLSINLEIRGLDVTVKLYLEGDQISESTSTITVRERDLE